jgi:ferredoxin
LADCHVACDFDAIEMDSHRLPVVDEERCTGCGDCVKACPKDLFSLQPVSHRLWVACSSLAQGDEMLEDCEVGCTACGRCAMDAPSQIEMHRGLPVIDYGRGPLGSEPTQRCPTGAIVWIDPARGPIKGRAAKLVVRQGDRLDGAS